MKHTQISAAPAHLPELFYKNIKNKNNIDIIIVLRKLRRMEKPKAIRL